jgi:ribonucleoside-diphosphate reductase alpha chain
VPEDRPDLLKSCTRKFDTQGCGNLYVTIGEHPEGTPYEIFAILGKAGGCAIAMTEAIGRLASKWLQRGGDPKDVVNALLGIRCPNGDGCPALIARALEDTLGEGA